MKKILSIFMIINVLIFTFVPNEASAVTGKVASATAKKVAKELIVDSAISMAEDIIFHKQMDDMLSGKYDTEPGYQAVCLDNKTECKQPVQVKKELTSTDKDNLGKKVEEILDRKAGTTGWVGWLDWIVPIFLVGTAVNWLTTTLDPNTQDLFNQVAEESMLETQLIKPLPPSKTETVLDENNNDPTDTPPEFITNSTSTNSVSYTDFQTARETIFADTKSTSSNMTFTHPTLPSSMLYFHIQRNVYQNDPSFNVSHIFIKSIFHTEEFKDLRLMNSSTSLSVTLANAFHYNGDGDSSKYSYMIYKQEDTVLKESIEYNKSATITIPNLNIKDISEIIVYPTFNGIQHRHKYYNANNDYVNRMITLIDKNGVEHKFIISVSYGGLTQPAHKTTSTFTYTEYHNTNNNNQISVKVHALTGVRYYEPEPYIPQIDEMVLNPIDSSKYKQDDGTVNVLPPTAVPIKTPEGVPVKPSQDSSSGWIVTDTGEQITVDEETLIVEDPIKTPEGYEMPDGTILPNVPDEPTPEPGTTPTPDDTITEEDFNGLGCERIKKPDFAPLETAITTSFPFSIPWDIYRIIEAVFGGMGSEKPVFNLNFDFLKGDAWTVTIPEFFDSWVPFAKTILLVTFDIALIYLFYRFTIGGEP